MVGMTAFNLPMLFTENPAQPTTAFVNEICPAVIKIYSRGSHGGLQKEQMTSTAEWTIGHYRESTAARVRSGRDQSTAFIL
jgi:hypothetical protein